MHKKTDMWETLNLLKSNQAIVDWERKFLELDPIHRDKIVLRSLPFAEELKLWTLKCHRLQKNRDRLVVKDLQRQVCCLLSALNAQADWNQGYSVG